MIGRAVVPPEARGAGFGLLPVGWTIFNAMLLYNITVATGKFDLVRRSVASLSSDARIQSIGGGATEVMLDEVAKRMR